jgi:hypothetical protein
MIIAHTKKSFIGQIATVMELDEKNIKAIIQYDLSYEFETICYDNIAEFVEGDF